MKTKITVSLLVTASFLFTETIVKAQSTTANNNYAATSFLGWGATSGDLKFKVNDTVKMTLQNTTGYLQVGNAASPNFPLVVAPAVSAGTLSSGGHFKVGIMHNSYGALGIQDSAGGKNIILGTNAQISDILFANRTGGSSDFMERMRITHLGNVGVGTYSPDLSALLHVSASDKGVLIPQIALTDTTDATTITSPAASLLVYNTGAGGLNPAGYYYNAGTPNSPHWVHFGDNNAWSLIGNSGTTPGTINFIGTTDNKDFVIKTNNTEKMRVKSGGNVGIGTTAPASKLDVQGSSATDIRVTSTTGTNQTFFRAVNTAGTFYMGLNNSVGNALSNATLPYAACFNHSGGYPINFAIQSKDVMTMLANGNVGIGTTAPSSGLELFNGDFTIKAGAGTPNDAGDILFKDNSGNQKGRIWTLPSSGTSLMMNGDASANAVMTINGSGYVGIGTSAPVYQLHIEGNVSAGSGVRERIRNLSSSSSTYSVLEFGNDTYPLGGGFFLNSSTNTSIYGGANSVNLVNVQNFPLAFGTSNTIRMTVTGAGNVGIGTTAPTVLLQVGSSGDGTVAKANAWNTFSDANFKTNVVTIKDALKKVLSLRGVTYDWIASGEPSIGFIAQEVDTVLSAIVLTDTLTGFKSLDYSKIVPVIVEGIKQLDSINTGLVSKDSINDAKIQALEATDSILNAKLQNQNSIIASLQNQLIASNTTFQNQLNELMTTINSCCNGSMESPTNNQQTKSLTIPEGEIIQTDVELNNAQTTILEQNSPNPFAERTSVNYYLPDNTGKAEMLFYNSQGKLIQSVELFQKGKGVLNVYANDLSSGIYTYTLIVDGKIIDSKKMVRNK